MTETKPKRRWFQFSLRTLLVCTLFVAIGCGFLSIKLQMANKQKRAVESFSAKGVQCGYSEEMTLKSRPEWLLSLFGKDFFYDIVDVDSISQDFNDADMVLLRDCPHLWRLSLVGAEKITDAGMKYLDGLPRLRELALNSAGITDRGVKCLKPLNQLSRLDLSKTKITDAGLEELYGLAQLEFLDLDGTNITDVGLAHLGKFVQLQDLSLRQTKITDDGLEHLKQLRHLSNLNLQKTQITNAGLNHLKALTSLHNLYLSNSNITDVGVEDLKKALPTLNVQRW